MVWQELFKYIFAFQSIEHTLNKGKHKQKSTDNKQILDIVLCVTEKYTHLQVISKDACQRLSFYGQSS